MKYFMITFLSFLLYSIVGWFIETIVTTIDTKKLVNRGFLIGPYCPVYGIGAISIVLILNRYYDDFFVLFIMSTFICSFVEYITSYIMEKLFNARWWDYSHLQFNINGRICLSNSILFGIGGLVVTKINPIIFYILNSIPDNILNILFSSLFTIFIIDLIVSFKIINKLKLTQQEIKKDSTGEITEKVKKILFSKSEDFKRLLFAFPNVKFNVKLPKKRKK